VDDDAEWRAARARRDAAVALTALAAQRGRELRGAMETALTEALHALFGAPPPALAAACAL
jgi:hypothetical protein